MDAIIAIRTLIHNCRERVFVNRRAVAAGQINIAITRIDPTASNAATAATETIIIRDIDIVRVGNPIL